jgi:hypothetical protein
VEAAVVVRAASDAEAAVWFVEESDIGLNAEAPTLEQLRDKLPGLVADLIEDNEAALRGRDIAVEIVAHAHTRIHAA